MSIDPTARIQSVHLTIADLDRSIAFYQDRLGFRVHRRGEATASLGADGEDLLVLHAAAEETDSRGRFSGLGGTTGLYHFAILVPSRPDLARALRHLARTGTTLQGFADHFVSEAIYLADPDGNGIEVYRDRPRDEWPIEDGRLRMGSDPLDLEDLLADAGEASWTRLPEGTRIGHVHLHVAHLEAAEQFYAAGLGFDVMQRYGGTAVFLSAGGYHHHVAVNTWAGVGAAAPPPGAIGLNHAVIRVGSDEAIASIARSLQRAGIVHEAAASQIAVADPSGNRLVISSV